MQLAYKRIVIGNVNYADLLCLINPMGIFMLSIAGHQHTGLSAGGFIQSFSLVLLLFSKVMTSKKNVGKKPDTVYGGQNKNISKINVQTA